jgi:hypothetical protein
MQLSREPCGVESDFARPGRGLDASGRPSTEPEPGGRTLTSHALERIRRTIRKTGPSVAGRRRSLRGDSQFVAGRYEVASLTSMSPARIADGKRKKKAVHSGGVGELKKSRASRSCAVGLLSITRTTNDWINTPPGGASVTGPLIVAWLPMTLRQVTSPLILWFGSWSGSVNVMVPVGSVPSKLLRALKLNSSKASPERVPLPRAESLPAIAVAGATRTSRTVVKSS